VDITPSTPTTPAEEDNCFNSEPGFCTTLGTTPNQFSVQLNTNPFVAPTGPATFPMGPATEAGWVLGDQGWVQFGIQSNGSDDDFHVCIWQNDFTQGKHFTLASNHAYISNCVATANGTQLFATQARDLKPFDSASVAGFAFVDADGTDHDLGIVATLTWWDPTKAPAGFRGLYAVVAQDLYSLWQSGNWNTISGTLLGYGGGSMAVFNTASVFTRLTAGNCAVTSGSGSS